MRQIMRSSLDYAGFAQLCGRSLIMCKIMRAHNRIIPRSLQYYIIVCYGWCGVSAVQHVNISLCAETLWQWCLKMKTSTHQVQW